MPVIFDEAAGDLLDELAGQVLDEAGAPGTGPALPAGVAVGPPNTAWLTTTGATWLTVPLYGLAGVNLAGVTVEMGLPGELAGEPQPADWVAAAWTGLPYPGEPSAAGAGMLVTAGQYAAAACMLWVRVTSGGDQRVLQSGRVRVGSGGS